MFESYFKSPYLQGKNLLVSLTLYLCGMIFIGIGAVLTINSHAGAGGYDALTFVLSERLGIRVSFVIYAIALLSVLAAALIRKGYPRMTTFISAFILGAIVDFCKHLLSPVQATDFLSSVVLLLGGLLLISFGVGTYLLSKLPANPIDDLVLAFNEKNVSIRTAKLSFDVTCFVLALILGGKIGWGTFVITICLGPLIQMWTQLINAALSKVSIARI